MKRQQMNDLPPLKTPTLNAQHSTLNAQGGHRSGVALVIVLGLLALLMITAVSFTILMRIERSGASNLRHASAARQMAKGGVAYAIAAMNNNIGAGSVADWTNRLFATASGRTWQERDGTVDTNAIFRIPEDIFISAVENEDNAWSVAYARVLSAESAHYLPAALRHRAEMIAKGDEDYAIPEWIPVDAMGANVGRYAYVILNTTGLLDANVVHNTLTNRWMGGSPAEMRLDPDVQLDVVNATTFASQRNTHGRYETLPELSRKNTGVDGKALANFDVFSYSLPDRIPVNPPSGASTDMISAHKSMLLQQGGNFDKKITGKKIDIRSEQKIKDQQAKIKLAFKASGLNDNQANWAYLGLLDYVDEDNEPAGANDQEKFERPATEAMPLFSAARVGIRYRREQDPDIPDNYRHTMTYSFVVSFSYPFQTASKTFKLEAAFKFNDYTEFTEAPWDGLVPYGKDDITLTEPSITFAPGDIIPLISEPLSRSVSHPKSDGLRPSVMDFRMECRARTINAKNVIVRQTPVDNGDYMTFRRCVPLNIKLDAVALAQAEGPNGVEFWSEALDPRCNWGATQYEYWRANADYAWGGSNIEAPLTELAKLPAFVGYTPAFDMAGRNSLTDYLLTHPTALTDYFKIVTDGVMGNGPTLRCDAISPQFKAHVADKPLQSVGELGYLPIGFWLTINLFDHGHANYNLGGGNIYKNNGLPPTGYHPVLDYFSIGDPDKAQRGKVNLNTVNPEVMGAVFHQLPLQSEFRKPAPPAARGIELAAPDALTLAEWLIDKGPFGRLSGLGRLFDNPGNAPANPLQLLADVTGGATEFGEFEREALIRNACGLFTLRGQTFTIILRADAFAPKFGMKGVKQGNVLATATAVAQVWRDTEPVITESRDAANKLVYTYNYPTFIQFFKILNE